MNNAQLGDVALINPRGDVVAAHEPVSFVGMAQLDAEHALAIPLETRPFTEVSKGYTMFRDGDVLAAKITPCWENGKIGQARLDHKIGVGSTEFHVVRPGPDLDGRYLLHFLRQPTIRMTGELRMTGSAGQRRVPATFLRELRIPVPKLAEQRRIAGILDQADTLRAKRRQILTHLDTLTQSIFHDMFGHYDINSGRSEILPLGDLISLKSGAFLPANAQEPGPYPVYGGNGVTGWHRQYLFEDPKVVIGRVGAYCGAVHLTPGPSWITDNALYVSSIKRELSLVYLRDALTAANLNQYASRSGQPLISGSRIKEVRLRVPSIDAQRRYEHRVNRIEAERTLVQRALDVDNELFASLQARAFKGEL